MEVTPFTFLNQEEDLMNFFSLYPEMQDFEMNATTTAAAAANPVLGLKKRRKIEEEDNNGAEEEMKKRIPFTDILTSLMILDEEEKQEQELYFAQSQQQTENLEANYKKKSEAMSQYYSDFQESNAQLNNLEQSRGKRSRGAAFAAAAAAVAASDTNTSLAATAEGGATSVAAGPHRRLWVKDRSKDWWELYNGPNVSEEDFRKAFRMSKATFNIICEELDSAVTKKNTMLRDAIPVRQRVAVCIWRLATGEPLRLVSKRFGLGISTCHKLVLEVCSAIKTVLMEKYLHWPDEHTLQGIKTEFESISGIPNVSGSMYTTHVPIIAPKASVAAYFNKRHTERNQKTSYSITVQGVVDPKGLFTDICVGWPGSMPDDKVLENSALYKRGSSGQLKDVWVVGNKGHPLMDWVLVPYTHPNLTWTQHAFNEKIGGIQGVAKDAFARLKGRWSCLQKRTEVKLQDLPVVLGACCVLHNICTMRNDELDAEQKYDLFDDEMVPEIGVRSAGAVQARDHIAHNLLHHGLAGTAFH
ncbi:protein ALP1-like [Argentina anserina]|uniref:protein ALP1-like n=1 Tax=Argentina anserina TaxID=57926 RepID=UPI00217642B4|nr:protein ALP1-like [Potentilla anserina]